MSRDPRSLMQGPTEPCDYVPRKEELPTLPAMTWNDAVRDVVSYVEDMVVKRPLSEEERRGLSVKARFWFSAGQDSIMRMVREMSEGLCNKETRDRAGSQRRPEAQP